MKKFLLIALIVMFNDASHAQYDLNQMILNGMIHYEVEIDIFPSAKLYTIQTNSADIRMGRNHLLNDSSGNYFYHLATPTEANLELLFREVKSIIDFYNSKAYGICSECGTFYQPSFNDINHEEITSIIEGDTPMRYLNLNKTIDYKRLAELGKDKSNFFAVVWCIVPNRLYVQIYMNNSYGNTGFVLYDMNNFKAY